jgi:hypothetical protein
MVRVDAAVLLAAFDEHTKTVGAEAAMHAAFDEIPEHEIRQMDKWLYWNCQ